MIAEDNVTIEKKLVLKDRRITVIQLSSGTEISVGSIELNPHDYLNIKIRFQHCGHLAF